MCGIVGVVGSNTAISDVIEGLKRLEYRGYDSSGVATFTSGKIALRKSVGKIKNLEDKLSASPIEGASHLAIGHTRWATHGSPSELNAHPHATPEVAVVHNGIIENYLSLRETLEAGGHHFQSETDTETIPVMMTHHFQKGASPLETVQKTVKQAEGAFAFGAIFKGNEDTIIASRRAAPLVVGLGDGANYLGSDTIALAPFTNRFIFIENDDIAVITKDSVKIYTADGKEIDRPVKTLDVNAALTGKSGYRHFMLKEIYEQPHVISDTLGSYLHGDEITFPEMPFDIANVPQINIIACGTSWHAALIAKYWIEQLAGVPVNVDIASEFRYRQPPFVEGGLGIVISQSGETADTLAALELMKEEKQHIMSIVNVKDSSIDRASDVSLYTHAGPEIGVASTKAFTTQLTLLSTIALYMAEKKGKLSNSELQKNLQALREVPARLSFLESLDKELQELAYSFKNATSSLYLARGQLTPIALEGALKLKEISYIHAEGYASGEMKHGPIALIDDTLPVVVVAPYDRLFEKSLSNMKEVEARHGQVILFTDAKGAKEAGEAEGRTVVILPDTPEFVQPLIYSIPMQLLAYHVAVMKGTDVDQPRNLAKSVTVE